MILKLSLEKEVLLLNYLVATLHWWQSVGGNAALADQEATAVALEEVATLLDLSSAGCLIAVRATSPSRQSENVLGALVVVEALLSLLGVLFGVLVDGPFIGFVNIVSLVVNDIFGGWCTPSDLLGAEQTIRDCSYPSEREFSWVIIAAED